MEKRQSVLVAFIGVVILAAGGFWWFTQNADSAPVEEVTTLNKQAPAPTAPALPPAPVVVNAAADAAPESDAVALSEEEVDKAHAETEELASREADLKSQVDDGKMLIDLKAKQIAKLEAELKALQAGAKKQ